ncbi:MAG: hypothetical protein P0Y55_06860 [Candidatus Cohnella colombiensis]|uniref:DUF4309 domain-containing protein n=1 Tax=Candidatus Cohnella colombiensis TaxID=3121368 RepID=A0AA95EZK4_9BACL|nr:MAG: hypothetical protein P0Y55_06860 [Cohnella sp.]
MNKRLLIAIFVLLLSGCSQHDTNTGNKENVIDVFPEQDAVQPTTVVTEDNTFTSDVDHFQEIMTLTKAEVLNKLGDDYIIREMWGDSIDAKEYFYEKYGIAITFNDDDPSMIESIYGSESVDIKGAKLGMTFSEIREILGEGEFIDYTKDLYLNPNPPYYFLHYDYGDVGVVYSAYEEDSETIELRIASLVKANAISDAPETVGREIPRDLAEDIEYIANHTFKPDLEHFEVLMRLTEKNVIEWLGVDFEKRVNTYYYSQYALEFSFDYYYDLGNGGMVGTIYGMTLIKNPIDINGAKMGMTFDQIESVLGKGELLDWSKSYSPESFYYVSKYNLGDLEVIFGDVTNDGEAWYLRITRNY